MFNALNRFISRLDSDAPSHNSNHNAFGFQVLRNQDADLAIEPWFDFIIGINGRVIENADPALFAQEVRNCAGSTVALGLWSAKGQRTRAMHIPVPASSPTLGLTLQYAELSTVSTIWHILDVPANSPADAAGLLPYSDYILGTPEGILHGESGLGELVEDHIGRPLRLFVYNNEYDVTREVTIHPSRDWGGEGALGCVLGFGALHRLPAPLSEPVVGPGETLFATENEAEEARFSNEDPRTGDHGSTSAFIIPAATNEPTEFLVPAQIITPPPPTGGPPLGKKEKRHGLRKAPRGDNFMDDYFMEGEKKGREGDLAPATKGASLPPPPKAKGPPRAGEAAANPVTQDEKREEIADEGGVD